MSSSVTFGWFVGPRSEWVHHLGYGRIGIMRGRGLRALLGAMNLRLLIDGIVRQTTVLVAQLSTTSGVRSPLAQIADQVFLQLTQELESQV